MNAGKTIVLVVLAAGLLAAPASASMYLDINPASGPTAIAIDAPTAIVSGMNLMIRLTGATPLTMLQSYMSVLSTNVGGGLINGTITDAWYPGTELSGIGSLGTASTTLDADGDTDIGSTNYASATGYMRAQKGNTDYVTQTDPAGIGAYVLSFQGTEWASANPHGVTVIEAIGRQKASASGLWKEAGVSKAAVPFTGNTITLYRPDDAKLDHDALSLDGSASMVLNGAASTGSINMWSWDVDGDTQFDVASALATSLSLSYDPIAGILSWTGPAGSGQKTLPAGDYQVKLRTEWQGSTLTSSEKTAMMTLLPEPATMALLGLGGLAVAIRRRRAA